MIIQRWQSVMLLIACIMMACFSFGSLGQIQATDFTFNFTALCIASEGIPTDGAAVQKIDTWYLFIMSIMSAVIPLIAIFCFKNFRLQKRLCAVSIMFTLVTLGIAAFIGYTFVESASISWSTAALEPFIAIVAIIIAYRLICSDERKIKSIDRFRD